MLTFIVSSASGLVVPRVAHSTPRCGAPTAVTQGEVHGEGGAYVAGHWVPLELCKEEFNIAGGSNEKTPAGPCPRSITRHSSAKPDGSYDVAIIGSGCIGAAVARELSKTTASVVMLEAADDVCQGATKGNSGIVHAGFDDKPGSVRAALCWKGNQLFPQLDSELHFGYQLTGSLVVAFGEEQEAHLHEARGSLSAQHAPPPPPPLPSSLLQHGRGPQPRPQLSTTTSAMPCPTAARARRRERRQEPAHCRRRGAPPHGAPPRSRRHRGAALA